MKLRVALCVSCLLVIANVAALGQEPKEAAAPESGLAEQTGPGLRVVVPEPAQTSVLYTTGEQVELKNIYSVWTPIVDSDVSGVTPAEMEAVIHTHLARMQRAQDEGTLVRIDSSRARDDRSFDVTFITDGSVPQAAQDALLAAEAYLEALFLDNTTLTINISFQNVGNPNILGYASSSYVDSVTYNVTRSSLINGMDGDDVIQDWLPAGSTVPVRYGSGGWLIDEDTIAWTQANYRAAVGSVGGVDANVVFNTQVSFDYFPQNGIASGSISFLDVAIHEAGHTLGFVSGNDAGTYMTSLDLYRFQRTDDDNDYNPDTYEEFQTTPRRVAYNTPDDQHISDLIIEEYRMSDGDPYQGSHFRQQSPRIGLMAPAIGSGVTLFPNYYLEADLAMFDAIGWDYAPDCNGNGVDDTEDLVNCDGSPWCSDCNNNGVIDECDLIYGTSFDCDGNGVPDTCDLAECDGSTWCSDCNGNGIIDLCDLMNCFGDPACGDCDANGVPDGCEYDPADCDGDGIADACELAQGMADDCNANGRIDSCDFIATFTAASGPLSPLGDNTPQSYVVVDSPEPQSDVSFVFEAYGDLNTSLESVDVEVNGTYLGTIFGYPTATCAADLQATLPMAQAAYDALRLAGDITITMIPSDLVGADECPQGDFISVTVAYDVPGSQDRDGNLVPDECQVGDMNCDGIISAADIDPFVIYLVDPATWSATYGPGGLGCPAWYGDLNGDGEGTAADIDPFVQRLVGAD
jgi:hypothetical protein